MREVVLKIYCDACGEEQDEGTATGLQITTDNPRGSYEMDLCGSCLDALLGDARETKPDRRVPPSNAYICEICGFAAKSPRGHGRHVTMKHGPTEKETGDE